MLIHSLSLKNYRNQGANDLDFSGHNALIIGHNGAGKTSILEAIATLSTTRSFKAKKELEVIQHGQDNALIKALRYEDGAPTELAITYQMVSNGRISKRYFSDGINKRASQMIGKLLTVLFTTDLINTFGESTATRRKMFNQILSEIDQDYLADLITVEKILKHKRKLLKMVQEGSDRQQLSYWNTELVRHSVPIIEKRSAFIQDIQTFLIHHKIDAHEIALEYVSPYTEGNIQENLIHELSRLTQVEIESGRCLVGPQRDDYDVFFEHKDIKTFASRGEQKFAMALLLYAIAKYIEQTLKSSPIILLDDLSAEMDAKNIAAILKLFASTGYQIIATAIDPNNYPLLFEKKISLDE